MAVGWDRVLKESERMADKIKEGDSVTPAPGGREEDGEEIARYQQILSREPSSLVFAALSEAYRKRNMLSQAVEVCRRGLHYHSNYVSGRVALARAYVDAGQIDEAREELERVVVAAPENLIAQRLLASIYRDKLDLERLERTLHAILSLDPQDGEAAESLRWVGSARIGPSSDGLDPDDKQEIVTQTLAEIYASQGYLERAVEIYERLRRGDSENPFFRERLSELKERIAGRSSRARGKMESKP